MGILGPRQIGKTTLAKTFAREIQRNTHFFDLENSEDLARLSDPLFTLKSLRGLIVIDEIQRLPHQLNEVHRLISKEQRRFLLTGSNLLARRA